MTDYAKDLSAELRASMLTQLQRAGAWLGTRVNEGAPLYGAAMVLEGLGADSPLPTREFLKEMAVAVRGEDRLGARFIRAFSRLADIPRVMAKDAGRGRCLRVVEDADYLAQVARPCARISGDKEFYPLRLEQKLVGVKKRLRLAADALDMMVGGAFADAA